MSAATATAPEVTDAVPAVPGKKKKVIIIAAALLALLLAGGGGAAFFVIKKRAAAAALEAGADGQTEPAAAEHKLVKATAKNAPTFAPLDPFTVNLADREAERYAQVGITLELADAKAGDLLKAYMPAIRNNILMVLAHKTSAQLVERDGKLRLANEIRREALRPLGYELVLAADAPASGAAKSRPVADDDEGDPLPIRAVHFSNFIIQ